jgi:hypothetical protein
MQPIDGFNEAPAYTGEVLTLPAGLYKCVIKQANVVKDQKDREQIAILFDIADGEYKGFYEKQFKARKQTSNDAKWGGIYKQLTHDSSLPFFKGIITSVEKSNSGYKWDWNEKGLAGKVFGGVFGREEFLDNNNEKRMATKCVQIRSVEGLKDAKIPEDKLLTDASATNVNPANAQSGVPDKDGFINIPDNITEDELPFM